MTEARTCFDEGTAVVERRKQWKVLELHGCLLEGAHDGDRTA